MKSAILFLPFLAICYSQLDIVLASSICRSFSLTVKNSNCSNLSTNMSYFSQFCADNKGTLDERCCTNGSSLVGLDLSSCSLLSFEKNSITGLNSSLAADILLLALGPDNPKLALPKPDDFLGQINLQQLLMPINVGCPLGWLVKSNSSNYQTNLGTMGDVIHIDEDFVTCLPPANPCSTGQACPINSSSECKVTGPGLFACPCLPGYTGYRCMRSGGQFPYSSSGIGWIGSVLAGCLIAWLLERRSVAKGIVDRSQSASS